MSEQQPYPRPAMERHIQTVLAALIVGLVGWVGFTLTSMSSQQAAMIVQVSRLESDVSRLTNKIENGVLPQTKAELEQLERQIERHETLFDTIWPRLREMKERIQAVEPDDAERWKY